MARKYFSVPFLTFRGKSSSPPPTSAANQARLYFDENIGELYISKNGSSWEAVGGQGDPGPPGSLSINQDGYAVSNNVESINFTGPISIFDDGYGETTVNIASSTALEISKNLSLNESILYSGYTLLGGTRLDFDEWDNISVNSAGYISRLGIGLEIIVMNYDTSTTIATQTFSQLNSSTQTSSLSLSGVVNLEIWGRLTGSLIEGDIGVLVYSELELQRN